MQVQNLTRLALIGPFIVAMLLFAAACAEEEPTPLPTPAQPTPTMETPAPTDPTPTPEPAADLPGEGVTVRVTYPTWTSEYVAADIFNLALEELGYTVQEIGDRALANPAIFTSISQGDIDVFANAWWPLHLPQVAQVPNPDNVELAGIWAQAGGLEGFLVDRATADAHGITSLADFRNPEIAALFDRTGDGRAEMVGCPPGWGCHEKINFLWEQYELQDHINLIDADYTPAMADTLSRFQAGESIFFYTWTPNWTVYALTPGEDVIWIEVPQPLELSLSEDEVEAGFTVDDILIEGVAGCVNDPCAMGFVGNDLGVLAYRNFLENNPAAARLFEVVEIPLSFVFEQNNLMFEQDEDSPADIRRHAEEWIAANQELFNGWLEEARQAAQ
jgi:glycine betaine/proline transport system substrate-binding protein